MKKIYYLFLFLILCACNQENKTAGFFGEIIPVNAEDAYDIAEIIDKIEITPLQTDDNCLVSSYQKMVYCSELELFIIFDKRLTVSLFTKDGRFISNSLLVQGEGPEDYRTIVDVVYSPFSKTIEVLSPYGEIYRYDTLFNFVEKISLDQNEMVFARFSPLSNDKYLLTPFILVDKDAVLYFCDYSNKTISSPVSYEKGYISNLTMNQNFVFNFNGDYYLSPLSLDYNFYWIDIENQNLKSVMRLDLGNKAVDENGIKKKFGHSKNRKNTEFNAELTGKINNYLIESNYPMPIIKFFNDHYVYAYFLEHHKRSTFIYNRKTKKAYMQTADSPFKLYFCLNIEDNVLIALVQAYELDNYIDKQYLSQESLSNIATLQEEDNPVIVKYYLRTE
jgi:hypothetical protein